LIIELAKANLLAGRQQNALRALSTIGEFDPAVAEKCRTTDDFLKLIEMGK
jgi:hypothetical protein